ncbi:MAG: phosphoserine phosphatase SerB [Alphaproteobacteria bacterium]
MPADLPQVLSVIGAGAHPASFLPLLPRHGEAAWLKQSFAFDIPFEGDADSVLGAARHAVRGKPVDVNVVPVANRRKNLLVADMDSTIVGCECLDEIARYAGHGAEVAVLTERAMRGELDFAEALRARVAMLKGLPVEVLAEVYNEKVRLNDGAAKLVATMRAHGARTVLVSGGFTYFTGRVAAETGFDTHQANLLLDDGGTLSGRVAEPILGREAKLHALERAVFEYGLSFDDVLAVGDGANDADMVRRAGLGVAWHAKPVLVNAADAVIAHADLTALLYLQGYKDSDIRTPPSP